MSSSCTHPALFRSLCVVCGAEVSSSAGESASSSATTNETNSGSNNNNGGNDSNAWSSSLIMGGGKALHVTRQEAEAIQASQVSGLVRSKRLALVLDLDHTLVHAAYVDGKAPPSNAPSTKDPDFVHLSVEEVIKGEVKHLLLKKRPHLTHFLDQASEFCQLTIYTAGTRMYAEAVARVIDPTGKLFSNRIISRSDVPSGRADGNEKSLKRIFLGDSSMAVIMDDREDVWKGAESQLLLVRAYHYSGSFADNAGIAAVGAGTGVVLQDSEVKPAMGSGMAGFAIALSGPTPGTIITPPSAWASSSSSNTRAALSTSMDLPISEYDDQLIRSLEVLKTIHGQFYNDNSCSSSVLLSGGNSISSNSHNNNERSSSSSNSSMTIATGNEDKDQEQQQQQQPPNSTVTTTTSSTDVAAQIPQVMLQKAQHQALSSMGSLVSLAQPSECESNLVSSSSSSSSSFSPAGGSAEATPSSTRSSCTTGRRPNKMRLRQQYQQMQLQKEKEEADNNKNNNANNSTTTTTTAAVVDMSDRHVADILGNLKRDILRGCVITFSGLIPVNEAEPQKHFLWKLAVSLGAQVSLQLLPRTTHLLAVSTQTGKVVECATTRSADVWILHPDWLFYCRFALKKALEPSFVLIAPAPGQSFPVPVLDETPLIRPFSTLSSSSSSSYNRPKAMSEDGTAVVAAARVPDKTEGVIGGVKGVLPFNNSSTDRNSTAILRTNGVSVLNSGPGASVTSTSDSHNNRSISSRNSGNSSSSSSSSGLTINLGELKRKRSDSMNSSAPTPASTAAKEEGTDAKRCKVSSDEDDDDEDDDDDDDDDDGLSLMQALKQRMNTAPASPTGPSATVAAVSNSSSSSSISISRNSSSCSSSSRNRSSPNVPVLPGSSYGNDDDDDGNDDDNGEADDYNEYGQYKTGADGQYLNSDNEYEEELEDGEEAEDDDAGYFGFGSDQSGDEEEQARRYNARTNGGAKRTESSLVLDISTIGKRLLAPGERKEELLAMQRPRSNSEFENYNQHWHSDSGGGGTSDNDNDSYAMGGGGALRVDETEESDNLADPEADISFSSTGDGGMSRAGDSSFSLSNGVQGPPGRLPSQLWGGIAIASRGRPVASTAGEDISSDRGSGKEGGGAHHNNRRSSAQSLLSVNSDAAFSFSSEGDLRSEDDLSDFEQLKQRTPPSGGGGGSGSGGAGIPSPQSADDFAPRN